MASQMLVTIGSNNDLLPNLHWTIVSTHWERPRQDGRHFPDDIFKCIFLNENVQILIKISLKFVPKDPINNIPALVKIMAWHRRGHKPLSEPKMFFLLTHICITQPQWVNLCLHVTRETFKIRNPSKWKPNWYVNEFDLKQNFFFYVKTFFPIGL